MLMREKSDEEERKKKREKERRKKIMQRTIYINIQKRQHIYVAFSKSKEDMIELMIH